MNLDVGYDKSEDEREEEGNVDQVVVDEVLNLEEENILKAISNIGKRPKFDVPTLLGNLNLEELIDWINELEEYFAYEYIEIKFLKGKMKGHTKI